MDMKEFYDKYNLNKGEFSEMAHVGEKSLIKYAKGEPLREKTTARINLAIRVVEKYDCVKPEFDYSKNLGILANTYRWNHMKAVREYKKNFENLLQKEAAL